MHPQHLCCCIVCNVGRSSAPLIVPFSGTRKRAKNIENTHNNTHLPCSVALSVRSPTSASNLTHPMHSPVLSHQQVMTSAPCLLQHLWKEESKCQHYSPNMEPENDGFQKEISFSKSSFFRFHVSLGGKSNPFKKSQLKDEGIASRCITTFSVDLTVAVVDLVLSNHCQRRRLRSARFSRSRQ